MKKCELCKFPASSYCQSDEACLCWDCDSQVHGANFLVARHTRSLLCQICQFVTPWKAIGAKLGRAVSICERCANIANLKDGKEEEESEGTNEEEEDTDNRGVQWSSTTPPPVASSSSSSASSSEDSVSVFTRSDGFCCESVEVKSLKRTRECYTDVRSMHQDDVKRSFAQRRYGRSSMTTGAGGLDGEGETEAYSLSLRASNDRRNETECSFQAGSRSVEVIDYLKRYHNCSNGKSDEGSEAVDVES